MRTERARRLMMVVLGTTALIAVAGSRVSFTAEMSTEEKIDVFSTLPDWSGMWLGTGTTLFDQSRETVRHLDELLDHREGPFRGNLVR